VIIFCFLGLEVITCIITALLLSSLDVEKNIEEKQRAIKELKEVEVKEGCM